MFSASHVQIEQQRNFRVNGLCSICSSWYDFCQSLSCAEQQRDDVGHEEGVEGGEGAPGAPANLPGLPRLSPAACLACPPVLDKDKLILLDLEDRGVHHLLALGVVKRTVPNNGVFDYLLTIQFQSNNRKSDNS